MNEGLQRWLIERIQMLREKNPPTNDKADYFNQGRIKELERVLALIS